MHLPSTTGGVKGEQPATLHTQSWVWVAPGLSSLDQGWPVSPTSISTQEAVMVQVSFLLAHPQDGSGAPRTSHPAYLELGLSPPQFKTGLEAS